MSARLPVAVRASSSDGSRETTRVHAWLAGGINAGRQPVG
jgi:hypothetical protein